MITRRRTLAAGAAAAWVACRRALAAERITLLVGASPGSPPDLVAHTTVPFLSRHLENQPIDIRNLPGEAGLHALQALADADPSGATLGWIATPTLAARMVDRDASNLLSRLRLLGAVQKEPVAFVSPPATPLESVQDIIRRSGADADAVPLGTPPPGSPPHLAALRLQTLTQTRLNIVTFPSAAAARAAAVAGNVAAAALGMATVIGDLREGRLSGLGIAAHVRSDALPDVPVLSEGGLDLAASIIRGVAAPAALPDAVAAKLAAALQAMALDPEFRARGDEDGWLANWIDGPTWTQHAAADRERLATLWATEPWLPSTAQ